MISQVKILLYYSMTVTVILIFAGLWLDQSTLLFMGKIVFIVSMLFLVADYAKLSLKQLYEKLTEDYHVD